MTPLRFGTVYKLYTGTPPDYQPVTRQFDIRDTMTSLVDEKREHVVCVLPDSCCHPDDKGLLGDDTFSYVADEADGQFIHEQINKIWASDAQSRPKEIDTLRAYLKEHAILTEWKEITKCRFDDYIIKRLLERLQ